MSQEKQVLIIDDDEAIHILIKHSLKGLGYEVRSAFDGKEGLNLFRTFSPPILFLDLSMPVMDGIDFLKSLSKRDLDRHGIIVMTASPSDENLKACFELGVHSFLRKPINPTELIGITNRSCQFFEANERAIQANARMNRLLSNLPEVVFECDPGLTLRFIGDSVLEAMGFLPEEMLGKPLYDFLIESELRQFWAKATDSMKAPNPGILPDLKDRVLELELAFRHPTQGEQPMMLSLRKVTGLGGASVVGVLRRVSLRTKGEVEEILGSMKIKVNDKMQVFYADQSLEPYLPVTEEDGRIVGYPHLPDYLADKAMKNVLEFAVDQREDLPFPLELVLKKGEGRPGRFKLQLTYSKEEKCLVGTIVPTELDAQLQVIAKQKKEQEKHLEQAVIIDEATERSILKDTKNLTQEILALIRELEKFAFNSMGPFLLEEYKGFLFGKSTQEYTENLGFLGNKIHSLKGTLGFVLPAAKELCHRIEEITKPLGSHDLVLTMGILRFLKDFIFHVQDMTDGYQEKKQRDFDNGPWLKEIDEHATEAREYMDDKTAEFKSLIKERSKDKGEVRHRRDEAFITVQKEGFDDLLDVLSILYYSVNDMIPDSNKIRLGGLYNEVIELHQRIQRIPMDLSRYERLVPSLAKEYGKQAEFLVVDRGVRGTVEFWGALHEIFNHLIKNALIHGLETIEERKAGGKDACGQVKVEMSEDAMNYFIKVSDDGRGIDLERVKAKALENQAVTQSELERMNESELLSLLFLQGLSTAERLDENAGRGVGLSAVKEASAKFKGRCHISTELGQGTAWEFRFPKSNISLTCVIVRIGSLKLAIPASSVESFFNYKKESVVDCGSKLQVISFEEELIPFLEASRIFGEQVQANRNQPMQNLALVTKKGVKYSLLINEILYHTILPLYPVPSGLGAKRVYLGVTLYKNRPVMVFDPDLTHAPILIERAEGR